MDKKTPIVVSSDMARKKYEENLVKLQQYEMHYQNTSVEKPKQNDQPRRTS